MINRCPSPRESVAGTIMCPHLNGSMHGAFCRVVSGLIRDTENADIRFCMSRHFEACSYYFNAFRCAAPSARTAERI